MSRLSLENGRIFDSVKHIHPHSIFSTQSRSQLKYQHIIKIDQHIILPKNKSFTKCLCFSLKDIYGQRLLRDCMFCTTFHFCHLSSWPRALKLGQRLNVGIFQPPRFSVNLDFSLDNEKLLEKKFRKFNISSKMFSLHATPPPNS